MKYVDLIINNPQRISMILIGVFFLASCGSYYFYKNIKTDLKYFLGEDHQLVKEMLSAENKTKIVDYTLVQVEAKSDSTVEVLKEFKQQIEKLNSEDFSLAKIDFRDEVQFFNNQKAIYFTKNDWKNLSEKINPSKRKNEKRVEDNQIVQIRNSLVNLIAYKRLQEFVMFSMLPDGLMVSKDFKQGMLIILHSKPMTNLDHAEDIVNELDSVTEVIKNKYGDKLINVRFNGYAHSLVNEYRSLWGDLIGSSSLVVIFTVLIVFFLFRSAWSFVYIYAPLFLGIGISNLFGVLFLKDINSNTAFLTSIVAGGSINTGIMILARFIYNDEIDLSEKIRSTLKESFFPSVIAMLTTALAFISLEIVPLKSFQDFALLGIVGTFCCWLFYFLSFPLIANRLTALQKLHIPIYQKMEFNFLTKKFAFIFMLIIGVVCSVLIINQNIELRNIVEIDMRKIKNQNYESQNFNAFFKHFNALSFNPRLVPVASLVFDNRADAERMKAALSTDPVIFSVIPDLRIYSISDIVPNDLNEKNEYIYSISKNENLYQIKKHPAISRTEEEMIDSVKKFNGNNIQIENNIPSFFKEIFSNKAGQLGTVLYLNFDLNFLEQNLFLLIKYQARIERLVEALGLKGSGTITGVIPVLAEVGKIFIDYIYKIYGSLFIGISFIIFLSVKKVNQKLIYFLAFTGTQLLFILGISFFNEKINIMSFFAVLLTLGVGVDYLINLNFKEKITADLTLYVVACSLTTVLSYLALYWGTDHLAIHSFARIALIGEVSAIFVSILVSPFFNHHNQV